MHFIHGFLPLDFDIHNALPPLSASVSLITVQIWDQYLHIHQTQKSSRFPLNLSGVSAPTSTILLPLTNRLLVQFH